MTKNTDDPEQPGEDVDWDAVDVGEPVDSIAARIAKNVPNKWTGSVWQLRRLRGIKALAWIGLILIALSLAAWVVVAIRHIG